MKTPINLNITSEDMNRATFPKGITWDTGYVSVEDNTYFTYVTRSGKLLKYTVQKEMQEFVSFGLNSEMRSLAELAIILDFIKHEKLEDTQILKTCIGNIGGHDFEILLRLNPEQVSIKKARKFCKRILNLCTKKEKLSPENFVGVTEENRYELILITDDTQRNIKLYNSILYNPFLEENVGHDPGDCGFSITDGNALHVYTLIPRLNPYRTFSGDFGDRVDALAALAAYTAQREGITSKIKAYADPGDINSDLMKHVNELLFGKSPEEILDGLSLTWRVQSFFRY